MSADTQRRSDGRSTSITDPLSDLENASDLGTRAMSGISTVVIASEWHFKPAGVMEVEKRFAEKRDRMRAVSMLPLSPLKILSSSTLQRSYHVFKDFLNVCQISFLGGLM